MESVEVESDLELHCVNKGLTDITQLAGVLSTLTHLNLSCNRLTSLSPLRSLTALLNLNVQRNLLTHLDGLAPLAALQRLDAGSNAIASLRPLAGLTELRQLLLHRNAVADPAELAAVLARLTHLEILAVHGNPAVIAAAGGARAATLATFGGGGLKACSTHCRAKDRGVLDFAAVTDEELAAASGQPTWEDIAKDVAAAWAAGAEPARGPRTTAERRSGTEADTALEAPASILSAVQLLPELSVPTRPSSLQRNSKAAATAALHKEPPTIYYSDRHPNGMPCVTLRLNGTGSVSWPSGHLAASADLDPGGGYRLLAMYDAQGPAPSVAVSVDAAGGFACYPYGWTAVLWKRRGEGTHYAPGGGRLSQWSNRRRVGGKCRAAPGG